MSFEEMGLEPELHDGFYRSASGINYTNLFFYEKKFFNQKYILTKRTWMTNNWHLSIGYAALYVVAIFAGQRLMRTREKFDLRRALIAWNCVLAAFSIVGAVRIWPEFIHTLQHKGLEHSMCSTDYTHGVYGCWSWLFILSKVPELVDTVFIVLRKQPLIFLHWYHHATVLVYCWFSGRDFSASGRWFVIMNYTVHACMYTYYAFRALRFKIPKWVNIAITSGQISQMIFGIYVNLIAYNKKKRGEPCAVSDQNLMWSFIMYFSYFVLFFHFFYKAYLATGQKKADSLKSGKTALLNGNGSAALSNGKASHHHDQNNNNNSNKSNGESKKAN